jgi:hypothetical protein
MGAALWSRLTVHQAMQRILAADRPICNYI